ncbi:hypothetical protein AGABI2DRAFT_122507 [Agaricus bisporus var. bisporus H97]|uniref:hypothetical protein n=1 Tax=Agaricus bisporus var. bisporus (strain H97 / ATCC MYA-4626 / FGSC 10389) TaxID=936046 RepID=UPI00029F65AB|nr:hypothetical protein AGABI2DRAFT_122507 [Agaricus bisporus var. bisporus H97]EKV42938.1 hypothetical protein AGABI2DRAFT_122507 [Agaricus bisporus var. bisporus H97]
MFVIMPPKCSSTRNSKTRCTCGYKKDVSYSTKQRHLRCQSKPEIAVLVLERSRNLLGDSVDEADHSSNRRLRPELTSHSTEDQHQKRRRNSYAEMIEVEQVEYNSAFDPALDIALDPAPVVDPTIVSQILVQREESEDKEEENNEVNGVGEEIDGSDVGSGLESEDDMEVQAEGDESHETQDKPQDKPQDAPQDEPDCSEESYCTTSIFQ